MSTTCKHSSATARRCRVALLLAASILLCAAAIAAETQPETTAAPTQPAAPAAEQAPAKCYYGCEQWGQNCNVDPRSGYKCQRVCKRFGQICE